VLAQLLVVTVIIIVFFGKGGYGFVFLSDGCQLMLINDLQVLDFIVFALYLHLQRVFIFNQLTYYEILLPHILLLLTYLHLNIVIHAEYLMVKGSEAGIGSVLGSVR